MKAKIRKLQNIISGTPTTDGDGVTMTRLIGSPELNMLDPFLLLDAFETDQVNDYIVPERKVSFLKKHHTQSTIIFSDLA